jgi:hypothetical protein
MIRPFLFRTLQPSKVSDLRPQDRVCISNDVDSDARELDAGILQVSGYGRYPVETSELGVNLRVPKLIFETIAQECAGLNTADPDRSPPG